DLSLGARSINNLVNRNFSLEGYVAGTFDLTPELRSTTTVGAQFFRTRTEVAGSLGRIFPAGPTTVANALRTEGTEGVAENRILGLYIQEQIAWRDRLFVTPAVRVDESSAFGMNLGRKVYPRIMASYVISEEDWFPRDLVESFRFRGAWGQSAKQPGTLASLQLLALQRTTFRGEDVAGVVFVDQGNPDLEPETGTEVELGWEASVLGGRLGVDFTFYHQITKDAIVQRDVPPSSGFPAPVSTNIGEIRNRGVEIGAYASALDVPGARWDWQLTLGTNDGEITRLDEPIHFGVDSRSQRHTEGYPFGAYFSRSYSIGGDGEVHSTDEPVFLGHPTPEYDGSLSTSLTLFDWVTLFAELGFAGGHQQLNSTEEFRCGLLGGGTYGGTCDAIFEEDTEGERTDAARIKAQAASDVEFGPWIEDASFARLRTVSARIEIPGAWLAHIGATRGSFTLAGENLALFTDYSGMDPEVNGAGGRQDLRVDFLTLPPARRVSGWVSITF
ncbi:MAG: TonB-dependent receptor, partial [Gemmatimonadota bacterium]